MYADLETTLQRNRAKQPPLPENKVLDHFRRTHEAPGVEYRILRPTLINTVGRSAEETAGQIVAEVELWRYRRAMEGFH